MRQRLVLGKWSRAEIDSLLKSSSRISDPGERVGYISERFLGTAYRSSTLDSYEADEESLVINLREVDCLTLLEYVEAMRRSHDFQEFSANLLKVRYIEGRLSFVFRKHFFIDWSSDRDHIVDVTKSVGGNCARRVKKRLNIDDDGRELVPAIKARDVEYFYIPSSCYDSSMAEKMKTGDYCGIFSENKGLDVSHTGILIKGDGALRLRHASSSHEHGRVVDVGFTLYIKDKPGFVVMRPVD